MDKGLKNLLKSILAIVILPILIIFWIGIIIWLIQVYLVEKFDNVEFGNGVCFKK